MKTLEEINKEITRLEKLKKIIELVQDDPDLLEALKINQAPAPQPAPQSEVRLEKKTTGIEATILRLLHIQPTHRLKLTNQVMASLDLKHHHSIIQAFSHMTTKKLITEKNGVFSLTKEGEVKARWFVEHPTYKLMKRTNKK